MFGVFSADNNYRIFLNMSGRLHIGTTSIAPQASNTRAVSHAAFGMFTSPVIPYLYCSIYTLIHIWKYNSCPPNILVLRNRFLNLSIIQVTLHKQSSKFYWKKLTLANILLRRKQLSFAAFTPVSGIRENKPKRLFSFIENERFWACFRENCIFRDPGVYKFGHRQPQR